MARADYSPTAGHPRGQIFNLIPCRCFGKFLRGFRRVVRILCPKELSTPRHLRKRWMKKFRKSVSLHLRGSTTNDRSHQDWPITSPRRVLLHHHATDTPHRKQKTPKP